MLEPMSQVVIGVVMVFFAGMGIYGLISPASLVAPFGTALLSADARNEVRAVYGGFGLAVAAALAVAMHDVRLRVGVTTTVALALAGMAAGRIISMIVERPSRFYPTVLYLIVEAALAAALSAAH